jgi:hypothetical protein
MKTAQPNIVNFVLSQIDNGYLFEDFAKEFTAASDGANFKPIGGVQDQGIDGLEFTYSSNNGLNKKIYQFSVEKNPKSKITRTLDALTSNGIQTKRLVYVTNIRIKDQEPLVEQFFEDYNVFVDIRDLGWFEINVNNKPQTVSVFQRFEDKHGHVYNRPSTGFELINVENPRIYIYLRQQVEAANDHDQIHDLLIDTLIFLALEGTDPDKNILCTKDEILTKIKSLTHFDPKWLDEKVTERLARLSTKPRKIKKHQQKGGYCLPYETRQELVNRQINDHALYEEFKDTTEAMLDHELTLVHVTVRDPRQLLENVFHRLFSQQGLEYSQFIETGDGSHSLDKSLIGLISEVITGSSVIPKNREAVRVALLNTIREIIYRGSEAQLTFLRRLADTYRLLFLLQVDPTLASYFEVLAGNLHIYVDTSILIPAISEYFLDEPHRRYSNLLSTSHDAGVDLIVNTNIIAELEAHLKNTQKTFLENYEKVEHLFEDETAIVYVPEILIRAYFYAKLNKKVSTFREFFENFVSWNSPHWIEELVDWVKGAFGIRFEETRTLDLKIDPKDEENLFKELQKLKLSRTQAWTDTKQLLMIYALREKNNELGNGGAFGYRTWWLTSDFNSQIAFTRSSDQSTSRRSPYIRADFLYNYVSLAPSKSEVKSIYKKVFPTLLGVNISFHIPPALCQVIQDSLKAHGKLVGSPRFKPQLRALTEQLKTNPSQWDKRKIKSWFSERESELKSGVFNT